MRMPGMRMAAWAAWICKPAAAATPARLQHNARKTPPANLQVAFSFSATAARRLASVSVYLSGRYPGGFAPGKHRKLRSLKILLQGRGTLPGSRLFQPTAGGSAPCGGVVNKRNAREFGGRHRRQVELDAAGYALCSFR